MIPPDFCDIDWIYPEYVHETVEIIAINSNESTILSD